MESTTRKSPQVSKMAKRGHTFLLILIALMIVSLGVWAYFIYCTPLAALEIEDSFNPTKHRNGGADVSNTIEADLNSVGSVDNTNDLNDIDQAFR